MSVGIDEDEEDDDEDGTVGAFPAAALTVCVAFFTLDDAPFNFSFPPMTVALFAAGFALVLLLILMASPSSIYYRTGYGRPAGINRATESTFSSVFFFFFFFFRSEFGCFSRLNASISKIYSNN